MLVLLAIAVVLSFDESMQAPIPGGEELHIDMWVQAIWVSYKHWVFGMNAKGILPGTRIQLFLYRTI